MMRMLTASNRHTSAKVEIVMLLLSSLACVVVLTASISHDSRPGFGLIDAGSVMLAGLAASGVLAATGIAFSMIRASRRTNQRTASEIQELRRRLSAAEALIKAEPQILIHWEQGKGIQVMAQTLTTVAGIPSNQNELLRFGFWLDQKSADELKAALDTLFANGRSFNMILRTAAGGHVEADGRAAGTRAILRLRDVAGYKRDLGTILDHHKTIARDIRSSRALLNALPYPVWLRDQAGKLTWVNEAYVKAVEAKSDSEVVSSQIELMESRQRRAIIKNHKSGKSYRERVPLIVGGDRKPHEVIALPLADATANVAIDVADLETAKGELDRLIAAYDRTLNRVPTAVAIFNADRRLTFFNDAYLKLWQFDRDWLETKPEDGAIIDRLRDLGRLPDVVNYRDWRNKLHSCYTGSAAYEDSWHLADGRIIHTTAERMPDGGVTYLFADETERQALESRYVGLTRVQGETLNSLNEGVAVFATNGKLQLFNTSFATIWRLPNETLAAEPHISDFINGVRSHFDDERTWNELQLAVTSINSEREQFQGQMVRSDASVIEYAATPLPDGATLLTFADVTDSKRYERALVERNEALVAADRLKNQFIGHVSYELRTPLTNIIGFSELLATPIAGDLLPKQREYLDDITTSSKTLLAIIDDILDLATIDAGSLELKLVDVDARGLINETVDALKERIVRAGLTLDIAIADDVSTFVADDARARQILYNLMSNAVGFSKQDGVVMVGCWREPDEIVFSVEDQGVGIPAEQQARVFERFESRSQGSKHRGAGLGLSIVKSLVALHKGRVNLESEPGKGTRVTVRLPERGAGRAAAEAPQPEPHDNSLDRLTG
jgi:signal transduction histidine kinase